MLPVVSWECPFGSFLSAWTPSDATTVVTVTQVRARPVLRQPLRLAAVRNAGRPPRHAHRAQRRHVALRQGTSHGWSVAAARDRGSTNWHWGRRAEGGARQPAATGGGVTAAARDRSSQQRLAAGRRPQRRNAAARSDWPAGAAAAARERSRSRTGQLGERGGHHNRGGQRGRRAAAGTRRVARLRADAELEGGLESAARASSLATAPRARRVTPAMTHARARARRGSLALSLFCAVAAVAASSRVAVIAPSPRRSRRPTSTCTRSTRRATRCRWASRVLFFSSFLLFRACPVGDVS